MYITASLYDQYAKYVDLDDRQFFLECLDIAKTNWMSLQDKDEKHIKLSTPVCYVSTLSSRKKDEDFVSRKLLNGDRGRRKFLMIDADFASGEEQKSQLLRERLIDLSERYRTPVLIYPTISYPNKPRFRAVLLVKRGLTAQTYWSAMTWLYDELMFDVLDASDLRITANRNLPIFANEEQIDAIYCNFDDMTLEPLDNALWKDIKKPVKKMVETSLKMDDTFIQYEESILLEGSKVLAVSKFAKHYETFWQVVSSLAAAVYFELIDEDLAEEMLTILADAAETDDQKLRWVSGNRELFKQFMQQYLETPENAFKARPLHTYTEFLNAINLKKVGEESNEEDDKTIDATRSV